MLLRGKKKKGESGILLHISSLPSKHGIGSFGAEAYRFIDFLRASRQSLWQILPLVPIGEGNSPYKSPSCFAGEPLFIDLDLLIRDGLLYPDELPECDFPPFTDYAAAREYKLPLIKKAARRFNTGEGGFARFERENSFWLQDYAVFSTALEQYGTDKIAELPEGIKYRMPIATEEFCLENRGEILLHKVIQYLFYTQYFELKAYAEKNGIRIIGDIPFYVSLDSADVWKNPEDYRLGRDLTPVLVAGVPPDIFSESGQLWGNPIYDFDHQKKTDFAWWKRRLGHCMKLYDIIRIDHFRAFSSYYTIPYGSPDARSGRWEKGVGLGFWQNVCKALGAMDIIAEDLGGEEAEVQKLVSDTGFPNMKVIQFAFEGDSREAHHPSGYEANCVCYTGTHDNDTVLGWYSSLSAKKRAAIKSELPPSDDPISHRLISLAMNSRARRVIIPMQDWLCLGEEARMNTPGTLDGNWKWRMDTDALSDGLSETIRRLSRGRN